MAAESTSGHIDASYDRLLESSREQLLSSSSSSRDQLRQSRDQLLRSREQLLQSSSTLLGSSRDAIGASLLSVASRDSILSPETGAGCFNDVSGAIAAMAVGAANTSMGAARVYPSAASLNILR